MIGRAVAVALLLPAALHAQQPDGDWRSYGRDPGGGRFSPLAQVTRENVGRLQVAWRFHTGETRPEFATGSRRVSLEVTPLVIDGTMYVSTPLGRVFALDAATGTERWRYNPGVPRAAQFGDFTSRGVSYWVDAQAPAGARCRASIVARITRATARRARGSATAARWTCGRGCASRRRSSRTTSRRRRRRSWTA